jgi:hypothetical protein
MVCSETVNELSHQSHFLRFHSKRAFRSEHRQWQRYQMPAAMLGSRTQLVLHPDRLTISSLLPCTNFGSCLPRGHGWRDEPTLALVGLKPMQKR